MSVIATNHEIIINSFLVEQKWVVSGAPLRLAVPGMKVEEADFWSALHLAGLHTVRIAVGAYFGHLRFRTQGLTARLVLPQDIIASSLAMSARIEDLRQRQAVSSDPRQRPMAWREFARVNGTGPSVRLATAAKHLGTIKSLIEARGAKVVDLNAHGKCLAELEILQWQLPDEDLTVAAAIATLRKIGGVK